MAAFEDNRLSAKLCPKPCATGSLTMMNTIGVPVLVPAVRRGLGQLRDKEA
jgi:hypothetical protein